MSAGNQELLSIDSKLGKSSIAGGIMLNGFP